MSKETDSILQGVTFYPDVARQTLDSLVYDDTLGMIVSPIEALSGDRLVRVLGFHATQDEAQQQLTPVTLFADREQEYRRLDDNAKGTGIMLGSSPQSIIRPSFKGQQKQIGAWLTPPLSPQEIKHTRSRNPESLFQAGWGIGRHALRAWVQAPIVGAEKVVEDINRGHGQNALITMNPAPTWLVMQRLAQKKLFGKSELPPTWALYRGKIPLVRIGDYQPS